MASDALSDREGAGPNRPNRDTRELGHSSSRKEVERKSGRSAGERIETQEEQGQQARENAGWRD